MISGGVVRPTELDWFGPTVALTDRGIMTTLATPSRPCIVFDVNESLLDLTSLEPSFER